MKYAAVIAALGKSPGGGSKFLRKIFVVLCVVHVSVSFAVSSGEDESGEVKGAPVLVGNFSISHNNDTQSSKGASGGEGLTGGKNKSCECSRDKDGETEEEKHADKIEQLLWDIFVDESSPSDHEDASEVAPEQEERYREGDDDDHKEESKVEMEAGKEDESVPPHSISKRSAEEELTGEERTGRRANPNDKRGNKGSNKKGSQKGKNAATPSRDQNRPRSKGKKKNSNVAKYNEYMDIVLKRMNTMIKTKKMDPLMVNLFSGNQQQNQANNKNKNNGENSKKKGDKNKKKKNKKDNKKKRKGAKSNNNRARLEELDEMEGRSVSSDSDSSATVELDNEHDGTIHTGVGGVFIRRVGEYESSEGDEDEEEHDGEEEDDVGEDSDGERSFREIRALIVNGNMKRSLNETESDSPSSPSPTVETKTDSSKGSEEETRGFSDSPLDSSEESPRKKAPSSKSKTKKDKSKSKKEEKTSNSKKPTPAKKTRGTRGVLKGLSSLKRSGNVDVVRQGDSVRIIRGKFSLGPVTLEIVPKVVKKSVQDEPEDEERSKKGKPKQDNDEAEPPKVTAIARELKGVIEVRLKKNSPTTIKRLRVFPPSAVNVKSSSKSKTTGKSSSVPRYNRVTPVATHRLRQIASAVVRQTDVRRKSSSLEKAKH